MSQLDEMNATGGRVLIAHLGNGASVTAVRDDMSIDTSMGFSPSGGLMMVFYGARGQAKATTHPSRLSHSCDVFDSCDCCASCASCASCDCVDGFSAPYRSLSARPPIQSDLSPAG
jgi:Acetokinase family